MKKGLTELVFILDKSGSMTGLEQDTIGGYNSMLEKQKQVEGDCVITTVFFDNEYELFHDRIDIKAVHKITDKDYFVGGSTALLDAMGRTIQKIARVQASTAEDYRAEKVLFVIITDGEENSSREYDYRKIKALVEKQKKKYHWEFIFLGANMDAIKTASRFGIAGDRAIDYLADSKGTELNFEMMSNTVASYRQKGYVDESYIEEIRRDVKKRGK